jgi:hypothetical protein
MFQQINDPAQVRSQCDDLRIYNYVQCQRCIRLGRFSKKKKILVALWLEVVCRIGSRLRSNLELHTPQLDVLRTGLQECVKTQDIFEKGDSLLIILCRILRNRYMENSSICLVLGRKTIRLWSFRLNSLHLPLVDCLYMTVQTKPFPTFAKTIYALTGVKCF